MIRTWTGSIQKLSQVVGEKLKVQFDGFTSDERHFSIEQFLNEFYIVMNVTQSQ